jgi:RNA polymerase sigma factor (sigma-70 family)
LLAAEKEELDRLLPAVARHDRAAFRRLYDAASPKLFGIILRIVKNRSLAEEVLQDAFLRIWEHAGSYSAEIAPAWAWITSIARNRAIDIIRQRKALSFDEPGENVDWYERIAESRDREGELIDNASLRACLALMEAQARDCVLFAYYEGLSREELAKRYARPVNTIKTWLHRSLAALRACLDKGIA